MTQDKPKTWDEITPEEKGALLLAHHEGKQVEWYSTVRQVWTPIDCPCWRNGTAYRVKPQPKREPVRIYGRVCPNGWWVFGTSCKSDTHLITFDTLDGKPDFASIRMEKIS